LPEGKKNKSIYIYIYIYIYTAAVVVVVVVVPLCYSPSTPTKKKHPSFKKRMREEGYYYSSLLVVLTLEGHPPGAIERGTTKTTLPSPEEAQTTSQLNKGW